MDGIITTILNKILADLECVTLLLVIAGLMWDRRRLLGVVQVTRAEANTLHEARLEDHAILAERAHETALTLQMLNEAVKDLRRR